MSPTVPPVVASPWACVARVELDPAEPRLRVRGPGLRVDLDRLHLREIDHDAVVAGREPGDVVAAAADRDRELSLAGVGERGDHVGGARAMGDQRRPLVDHRVPDASALVVARVGFSDETAAKACELRSGGGHGILLGVGHYAGRGEYSLEGFAPCMYTIARASSTAGHKANSSL